MDSGLTEPGQPGNGPSAVTCQNRLKEPVGRETGIVEPEEFVAAGICGGDKTTFDNRLASSAAGRQRFPRVGSINN